MVTTDKVLLIQPRHIYAPPYSENHFGHIYMPNSLFTIAAILSEIGIHVKLVDQNVSETDFEENIIGVNLLGAPYIPSVISIEKELFKKYGDNFRLLIGGQVVSGFNKVDFANLFSDNTLNGNLSKTISEIFNIDGSKIPKKENISLIKIYEQVNPEILKIYLSNEFGFYLSQGCKYACSFCAAQRTISTRTYKRKLIEQYRNIDIALNDFEFLIKKAIAFKIESLRVYLSNLDLFQNPLRLGIFAEGLVRLKKKYPTLIVKLRGLSTSRSFLNTNKDHKTIIHKMIEAGLEQIGFGIDGATPKVYRKTRKPQNVQECLDAIKICRETYNISPETLMVFGHNNFEDEEALYLAVKFCKDMQSKYNAIPRAHVAKDIVPGNDGWRNPNNQKVKNEFYKFPILFQNLDFTAIPSPITHPDSIFRKMVTKYYKMACELPNSLTQMVLAELPTMTTEELALVRLYNKGRYDI